MLCGHNIRVYRSCIYFKQIKIALKIKIDSEKEKRISFFKKKERKRKKKCEKNEWYQRESEVVTAGV